MLAEGLKELAQQTQRAMLPVVVDMPDGADPSKGYVFYPSTSKVEPVELLPPARGHQLLTLMSLANAIARFASSAEASLWCSLERVVALCDDGAENVDLPSFRKDKLELPLFKSPLWALLANIGGKSLDQKSCYRIFKHDLSTAVVAPAGFIDVISSMKFDSGQQITGEVSAVGKNTFGKSVMAEARGSAELPEEVDIAFDPWPANSIWEKSFQVAVKCSVFVDAVAATIAIVPQPGELELAKCKALDALCMRVAEVTGISADQVFAGTP